jgi:phage terminase large subunit-like protein
MAGVLLLGIAFVRVMVAVYLARGRGWARVIVAVFALLSLAAGLAQLFQGRWLAAAVTVAVDALVLYLLFNAQSSTFFRARAAEANRE